MADHVKMSKIGAEVAKAFKKGYVHTQPFEHTVIIHKIGESDNNFPGIMIINWGDRLTIKGRYPMALDRREFDIQGEKLSFTMNEDRSAVSIASNINRKIWQNYVNEYNRQSELVNEHNEYLAKVNRSVAHFAELTKGKISEGGDRIRTPFRNEGGYIHEMDIVATHDYVNMTLRCIPNHLAEEIIKLLNF